MGARMYGGYPIDAESGAPVGRHRFTARLWQALALLCVGIAMLGTVVPLLPTTPFLLIAVAAGSRGSPALGRWLESHPRFGPLLRDWRDHRAIRPRVKRLALALIAASWLFTLVSVQIAFARTAATLVLLAVTAFIATRPDGPAPAPEGDHD